MAPQAGKHLETTSRASRRLYVLLMSLKSGSTSWNAPSWLLGSVGPDSPSRPRPARSVSPPCLLRGSVAPAFEVQLSVNWRLVGSP